LDHFEWLVYGFGTRHSSLPDNVATLRQIHSDIVLDAAGRNGCLGEGDALVSNHPRNPIAVKTADCIPILLVDESGRAVAAVHAGWRGTAQGIVRRAVEKMVAQFDTATKKLHAAIGPGIRECCYEVGPEVAAQFGKSGRVRLALAEINRQQLTDAGVGRDRIYEVDLCSACSNQFWSFRRDKEGAGRMLSFAGIR
jgi:YfiH family protein